jgi:hypothetical protein
MVNLFILFWSRQTARQKATFIIIGLLLCTVLFIGSQKAYYKYKYFKGIEKQRNELLKVVEVKEFKIDSLLNTQIVVTKDIQKKSKAINTKLKQDVKEINNSMVTDKQLHELLAKYD